MKIKVTREDIDRGIRSSKCYCPIALAVNRETGFETKVGRNSVSFWSPTTMDTGYLSTAVLPDKAVAFISEFDSSFLDTNLLDEFEFDLVVPGENRD